MRRPALVGAALAAVASAASAAPAQQPRVAAVAQPVSRVAPAREAFMVRRDLGDRRVILRGQIADGSERAFYRTRKDVIYEIEVAPENRYTAAIESADGTVENGEYAVPPRDTLVILDGAGNVVRQVDDVQRYVFSPDGRSVAYVVGAYYEGGVGFLPRGTYVLEIESGATRQVEVEDVYELNWVRSEQRDELYLRTLAPAPERRVMRYEIGTRRLSPVPSGAFHLSPDGRYYLSRPYELIERGRCDPSRLAARQCYGVFESRSDRPVAQLPPPELGEPLGWAFNEGRRLLLSRTESESALETLTIGASRFRVRRRGRERAARTTIWDVSEGRALETLEGASSLARQTHRWTTARGELLLRPAAQTEAPRELSPRRMELRRDPGPGAR